MVDHPRQTTSRTAPRQESPEKPAATDAGGDRIAKALARAGVASRRDVERLIEEGRVALNGKVLTTPAVKVSAGDILTVDGQVVEAAEPTRLWRYHKPVGLVTTHKDPHDRPTVFQHMPGDLPRVISIGRLDLNSEGLLLLTNDGELARALELPSTGWVRRYRARAYGSTTQAKLDALKKGIVVEGVAYGPIEATLDKVKQPSGDKGDEKAAANVWVTVALTEGKNREVRRVLEAIGLKVNRLIRLAYGPFALATLPTGAVEEVGPRVIREQLAGLIAPENLPKGDRRPAPAALPETPNRRSPTPARGEGRPRPAGPRRREGPPVEVEKKEHKPGWAKAKHKSNPHAVAKPRAHGVAKPHDPDVAPTTWSRAPAKPRGVQIEAYPASHRAKEGYKPRDGERAAVREGAKPRGPDRPRKGAAPAGLSLADRPKGGKPARGAFKPGGDFNKAAKGPAWTRNRPDAPLKDASGLTPYERAKLEFGGKPKPEGRADARPKGRSEARPSGRDEARGPRPKGPAWARPAPTGAEVDIKPWAERAKTAPGADKPRGERPAGKPRPPGKGFGASGAKPAAGRPSAGKAPGAKPFGGKPSGDRPRGPRPPKGR